MDNEMYAKVAYAAWPNQIDPQPYLGDPMGADTEPQDVPWDDLSEYQQYQLAAQTEAVVDFVMRSIGKDTKS